MTKVKSVGMKIILGSQSRFRAQALQDAGITIDEMMSPGIDEKAIRDENPERLVLMLAKAKAEALLPKISEPAILITADQVVMCNGEMREKPKDKAEAMGWLASYVKYTAEAVNGLQVVNTATGKIATGIDRATIIYKPTLLAKIKEIIDNSFAMEAAGALVEENALMTPHELRRTGEVNSFMGMPIELLKKLMAEVE